MVFAYSIHNLSNFFRGFAACRAARLRLAVTSVPLSAAPPPILDGVLTVFMFLPADSVILGSGGGAAGAYFGPTASGKAAEEISNPVVKDNQLAAIEKF